jgi:hypothetical protein
MLQDEHFREKRALMKELKDVNRDMQNLKVSVVYIHLIYSVMGSCYLWPLTGSSECKLLACAVILG